jgi:hypothetical protein
MADNMSISGQVRSYNAGTPIFMIKVSVYREPHMTLIEKTYTGEDGKYTISIPTGEPITVSFDTHPTLNNSRHWHPSVIANLEAGESISLDRLLLQVGTTGGLAPDIDALVAYEFSAALIAERKLDEPEQYGKEAVARLSELKIPSVVLEPITGILIKHFESL